MSTTNCQGDPVCDNWQNSLNLVQLPQAVGAVTMTCQDGAGTVQPCTTPPQSNWLATVNVTVTYSDLRRPNRTVTLSTRIMRP